MTVKSLRDMLDSLISESEKYGDLPIYIEDGVYVYDISCFRSDKGVRSHYGTDIVDCFVFTQGYQLGGSWDKDDLIEI